MRKIIALLLILSLSLGLFACGQKTVSTPKIEAAEEEGTKLSSDDPIYSDIECMEDSIIDFVEYNHILNNSIDYDNVGAEDFWNIVALAVAGFTNIDKYAEIDGVGVYHIAWDTMIDFAKTFLYKSWFQNNAPSYKTSYSASADPGSGVIDLIPLSVDNFIGTISSIESAEDESKNYDYILHVDLATNDENPTVHHYHVFISSWQSFIEKNDYNEEVDGHAMPFVVTGYQFLGTDEPQN